MDLVDTAFVATAVLCGVIVVSVIGSMVEHAIKKARAKRKEKQEMVPSGDYSDRHEHWVILEYYPLDNLDRKETGPIHVDHVHEAGHHDHRHSWSVNYKQKWARVVIPLEVQPEEPPAPRERFQDL